MYFQTDSDTSETNSDMSKFDLSGQRLTDAHVGEVLQTGDRGVRTLRLSYNMLTVCPGLDRFSQLEVLDLRWNEIREVGDWSGLRKLKRIPPARYLNARNVLSRCGQ